MREETIAADNAEHAIRETIKGLGGNPASAEYYVAVPTRSWKPMKAKAKQTVTIEITPATSPS